MSISNLAFQFVSVTEQAAIASTPFIGKEDRHGADKAATDAMRKSLGEMNISARIVIGEGERDEAPMLFIGEELGLGGGEGKIDIAVDPLEGTNLCAANLPGAICVMAIGPEGSLFAAPDTYMDKIVVGKEVSDEISLDHSIKENLRIIAHSYNIKVNDLNIIVLDRERHIDLIANLREEGAHVHLISDGDVCAGISAALPHMDIHALMGVGAAPEGVIKAVAIKGLGGKMRARFKPHTEEVKQRMIDMGITDFDKEYTENDLAKGDDLLFVATGVTSGDIMQGIKVVNGEIHTDSVFISTKAKQISKVQTVHLQ